MSKSTKEQKHAEYLRHKERYSACSKEWVKNNPDKRKDILKKWNKKAAEYKRLWQQRKDFGVIVKLDECVLCGDTEKLLVHHKDGNNGKLGKSLNNDFSNLVILCRSCHPKVHYRGEVRVFI